MNRRKHIASLKAWQIVRTKSHSLESLKGLDPKGYLYQLSSGTYYPVVRLVDVPAEWDTKQCYTEPK